jgi:hypothetical protein
MVAMTVAMRLALMPVLPSVSAFESANGVNDE